MQPPVAVLTGAGLSTASGIPDYRSADGVWTRFDPEEFHVARFRADPDGFWSRRMRLIAAMGLLTAGPNEGHLILARAARAGTVSHIVTQNIDGLHHKADTPPDQIIEVHGNAALCRCVRCGAARPTDEVVAAYAGRAPRCTCGSILKPDVVLFGEPVTRLDEAQAAVSSARTLVTVGTSLQVWPVAGLVQMALDVGLEVVVVNRDETPFDAEAGRVVRDDVVKGLRTLFPDHVA